MKLSLSALRRAAALLAAFALAPLAASAAPANVTVSAPVVNLANTWLLDTDPANDTVRFSVAVSLSRNQPLGGVRDIPVTFRTRLRAGGTTTALGSLDQTVVVTVDPVVANLPVAVNLAIDPTVILSEDIPYELVISVSHNDDPPGGVSLTDHSINFGPLSFAHFSGALVINGQTATIQGFASAPLQLPADQAWRLRVQSGMLADGTPFTGGVPATPTIDVLRNDTTGVATLTAGTLNLAPPGGPVDVNGWEVFLGPVTFGNSGRLAQGFTLRLPPGAGWRLHDTDPNTSQLLTTTFGSATALLPLNDSNQPTAGASGALATPHEFVDERAAVGFVASAWQWDLFHLRLTQPATRFLRAWYFEQWKIPQVKGELPDSNDGFWDGLNANASGDLLIAPGLTGGFNATLTFANGVFSTHFPHGFVAHTGGSLQLVNGLPTPAASAFPLATVTMITYRGCRPEDQPHVVPDPSLLEAFQVGPGPLRFTAHGSLWTEGLPVSDPNQGDNFIITRRAAAGTDPDSGLPVHQTANYTANNIQLLVPGPVVAAADGLDQSGDGNATVDEPGELPEEFNPARWLLTGLRPAESDALEHPGTPAYLLGEGDYAGANFRVYPGLAGISRVGGGVLGPYTLDLCQKLYARASGVSGRWVADAASLPPSVQIGGPDPFTLEVDAWAFQLIGNEPQFEHSTVSGSLAVPYPADFTLAFDELDFKCCGAIDRLAVAEGDNLKQLAYWQQARIDIQSARFVTGADCSMDDTALELGVLARANGFPDDLDGILRVRGNGRLTTGTDPTFAASVLHVPNVSLFARDYSVTGVGHAYYNDPISPITEDNGWINFAGMLALPFFENMEIHAILLGTDLPAGPNPDVIPGLQGGWEIDDSTHFNNLGFDTAHRGLPPAFNTPIEYLGSTSDTYLPRAEKTWFGLIPFDFPVQYSPLTFTFRSKAKKEINVIIADAEADVPRLNASEAAIEFGATFGLSLNNLFANALEFASDEIAEGFGNLAIGPAFEDIDQGLDELDNLLSQQIDNALDAALNPVFDNEVVQQAAQVIKTTGETVDALNQLEFNLNVQNLIANAVAENVSDRLGPIGNGLQGMRTFLAGGQPASSNQVAQLMHQAMGFLNLPPGFEILDVAELVQLAGVETGPLRDRLEELRARMQELRELVQDVTGLDGELQSLLQNANAEFAGLQTEVRAALQDYFDEVALDPSQFSLEEIEARIRAEVKARIYALPVMSQVQDVLRFRFYHLDHLVQQVLAHALEEINEAITDAVAEVIDLDGLLDKLGGFGNYIQSASMEGEAVISGGDLTYLALSAHTVIQTQPMAIALDPFFEYQQLHSDGAEACDDTRTPQLYNRITMGVTAAPANVPFGNVNVTVSTQFSFTEDGIPIGFKGTLETLTDGLSMQPVNFDRMSATLAVDASEGAANYEFYLAAEAEATMFGSSAPISPPYSNFKLHGGLFVGRTCSDLPYAAWAPQTIQDELTPPLVGIVTAVNGKFPFYDAGCLLRVKAGAAVGAYGVVQGDPTDYSNLGFAIGSYMRGEVSGDFLCLVSSTGALELFGAASQDGVVLSGGIENELKLGPCPLCIELEANFGVTFDTSSNPTVSVDF